MPITRFKPKPIKKELSYKIQKYTALATIIGLFISFISAAALTFLGVVSLYLTKKYGESSQKVDSLNIVIGELVKQGRRQDTEISMLSRLDSTAFETYNKTSAQLTVTQNQASYIQNNERPLVKVKQQFLINKPNDKRLLKVNLINTGRRDATEFRAWGFLFSKIKDSIGLIKSTLIYSDKTSTVLFANDYEGFSFDMNLPSDKEFDYTSNKIYCVIKVKYKDPIAKRDTTYPIINMLYYYQGEFESDYPTPEDMRDFNKYLKNNKKVLSEF